MSSTARIAVVVAAIVILVTAFILLQPDDVEEPGAGPVTTTATATTTTSTSPPTQGTTPTTPAPTEPAEPAPTRIVLRGLEPEGGVQEVRARKGEDVAFTVTSDEPEAVHLHGYDIEEPVGPGAPARFEFTADIDGIFEVELENSGVQIAELRVEP